MSSFLGRTTCTQIDYLDPAGCAAISMPGRHIMIRVPASLRPIVQIVAVAAILAFPRIALTHCAGISEEGRWRNLENTGEPSYIDVKMLGGCGDQVLNG